MRTGRISLVCALAWLGACGSSKSAEPAAGAPAGEAVEVSGAVSVVHEGAEQPLVVGAKVFGADEIVTGSDGAVTIRLFHNDARWTLESGKRKRVDASLAWSAPRRAAGGVLAGNDPDDSTAAAGRHTEKEAGDTRATAALVAPADEVQREAEAREAAPAAAAPPPPPPKPAKRSSSAREVELSKQLEDVLSSDKAVGGELGGGTRGLGIKGTGPGGGGGGGTIGTSGTMGTGGTGEGYGTGSSGAKRKPAAPRVSTGAAKVSGSLDVAVIRRVIQQHMATFKSCHERAEKAQPALAGKVIVKFTITAKGTAANVSATGDAALEKDIIPCVVSTIEKLQFPAPADGAPVQISYPLVFKAE